LEKVANTQVGDQNMNPRISGGERKRMCIGRELLSEPKLLLCDEPTSGLDSTMAHQVVSAMRALCDSGKVSMISSIHQPSTLILETFDDAILLREGKVIYNGPVKSVEALFTSCGPQRSPAQSVAEYLMDCLILPEGDPRGMSEEAISMLAGRVKNEHIVTWTSPAAMLSLSDRFNAPFCRQLALLLRLHGKLLASLLFTKVNVVQNIGLMLVPALLFNQLGLSDLDIHPRFGLVLWVLGTWMFFPLFANIQAFQTHRKMLEKELKKGCYSLEAYYITRTLLVLPLNLVWPLFWTAGVYWIANANPNFGAYIQFQPLVFLNFAIFEGAGQMISAIDMSSAHANTLTLICITFWFAWSGFFLELNRIPEFVRWMTHGNVFMYGVQLGVQILLSSDLTFSCEGFGSAYTSRTCESAADTFSGLEAQGLVGIDRTPTLCMLVLVGTLFVTRLLTYGLLRYNLHAIVNGVKGSVELSKIPANPSAGQDEHSQSVGVLKQKDANCTEDFEDLESKHVLSI